MALTQKIYLTLTNNAFLKNKKIGIAVSGGADSMVLLDLFCKLTKHNNLKLYAIHYNHKWRKESVLDADLVRNYCKKNNIYFVYGEDTKKAVKDEEIAREKRYLFFRKCIRKYQLDVVCTAHHFDDQIETILFRLCRGTGPKGLLPIKEYLKLNDGTIFYRPFLELTKKEIYLIAKRNNVPYTEDKSNDDIKYKRNLIRKKIIPLLVKVNKNSMRNFFHCSELVYAQNKVLDIYFLDLLNSLSAKNKFNWDRKKFLKLDLYTQKAFIYWFLSTYGFKGNATGLNLYLNAILHKKKFDVNKNYIFSVSKKHIVFNKRKTNNPVKKEQKKEMKFSLNGQLNKLVLDNNQTFIVREYRGKMFKKRFPPDRKKQAYVNLSDYKNKTFVIRNRKAQDVFYPLGFSNNIKLKKYLINKKIPEGKRYKLPLLCLGKEVLWIPGYSLSEKIKVLDMPTHILELRN